MSLLNNLPHRCTIAKRKRSKQFEGVGSAVDSLVIVQFNVKCWEQREKDTGDQDMQKRGVDDLRKVYFAENLSLDENHVVIITVRNGVEISSSEQRILSVVSIAEPDISAGTGSLWRVMCQYRTGASYLASEVSIN